MNIKANRMDTSSYIKTLSKVDLRFVMRFLTAKGCKLCEVEAEAKAIDVEKAFRNITGARVCNLLRSTVNPMLGHSFVLASFFSPASRG